MRHFRQTYGFYAVFLKEIKCGDMIYGRHYYDYQEGTLVCLAPGQVIGFEDDGREFQPKGWALVFHPDLIRGTSLGRSRAGSSSTRIGAGDSASSVSSRSRIARGAPEPIL